MAGIRLDRLQKAFGATRAVEDVTLDIPDGEFVVFVGPSGCGKTTTLNMIAGLERPTSGDIWIGEDRVTDWEPRDRNLGMVFQSLALFPHMTVADNIGFPLRLRKLSAVEIAQRVRGVATTVRVEHLLDKRPGTLSGGEAQRVALARTLVVKPAVFLMDEPLSSLDAKLRVEMRTELKRLHADLRATFVYVTHDQAEAMTMADRIVVMHQGRVQQVGPPLAVYGDPANRFVAGFFGVPSMNFVEGEIREESGSVRFLSPALRIPLRHRGPAGPAVLGVRPEHVRLVDAAGAREGAAARAGDVGWPAAVSLLEPMGDETLAFLDYGGPVSLVAKVDAEEKIAVGERRHFTFRFDKVLFFEAMTGLRQR
jgi:multiple sugar transport system ATP-binding protein